MAKSSTGLEENIAGLLCYVAGFVTGLIFFLIEKDSKFVKFHSMQSIVLCAAAFLSGFVIGIIPVVNMLSPVIGILFLVLWIVCMVKAYQGDKFKIPIIGDLAETWSA